MLRRVDWRKQTRLSLPDGEKAKNKGKQASKQNPRKQSTDPSQSMIYNISKTWGHVSVLDISEWRSQHAWICFLIFLNGKEKEGEAKGVEKGRWGEEVSLSLSKWGPRISVLMRWPLQNSFHCLFFFHPFDRYLLCTEHQVLLYQTQNYNGESDM
jgi:hypothetical protein